MRLLDEQAKQEETEVQWEDQQRINAFSRLNAQISDFTALNEKLQHDKESADDALMELELADEDDKVPYRVGDTFMSVDVEEAREMLQNRVETVDAELSEAASKVKAIRGEMDVLRKQLYAKFGQAINLESDAM